MKHQTKPSFTLVGKSIFDRRNYSSVSITILKEKTAFYTQLFKKEC